MSQIKINKSTVLSIIIIIIYYYYHFLLGTKIFSGINVEAVKQHGMYTLVKDCPLHISANMCMLV